MKVLFFLSSLLPLSVLIFLKLYDFKNPLRFLYDFAFYVYAGVPLLAFCFLIVTYNIRSKVDTQAPKEFVEIQEQKSNFFIPISTYFIPFISSNFYSINDYLVAFFVILLVGILVIKMDLQYLNPLIPLIFGDELYKAKVNDKEVYVLSKNKLSPHCKYRFNRITSNLYKIRDRK